MQNGRHYRPVLFELYLVHLIVVLMFNVPSMALRHTAAMQVLFLRRGS